MIVKTDFLSAINYAKDHDIMVRPEYWSLWIMYDKDSGCFMWANKNKNPAHENGYIKNVNINDKILRTFRWEFMCDSIDETMINTAEKVKEETLGDILTNKEG